MKSSNTKVSAKTDAPLKHALHVVVGHRGQGELEVVADGNFAVFCAFVIEGNDPLLALKEQVFEFKPGNGTNTRPGISQDGQNRAVSQPDQIQRFDGLKKLLGFLNGDFRGFPSWTLALVSHRAHRVQDGRMALDLEIEEMVLKAVAIRLAQPLRSVNCW